ncbi:MAG: hypothetical protein AVDCRST_MAG35-537, partial [uncultured Quadrisphaera sp.]
DRGARAGPHHHERRTPGERRGHGERGQHA